MDDPPNFPRRRLSALHFRRCIHQENFIGVGRARKAIRAVAGHVVVGEIIIPRIFRLYCDRDDFVRFLLLAACIQYGLGSTSACWRTPLPCVRAT
jgi:hypothetical protein